MSQYSEYDEENLVLEQDERQTPLLSDDPESHTRHRAHEVDKKRSRSSDSGSRKRQVSKSELQRQLSRQKSIEAVEKKGPEPTARTALILEEKVETGSVRPM